MSEKDVLRPVRVAEGRRVVTPAGTEVPAGGFTIDPRDPWWARALTSGDVVELTEAEIAAMKAEAERKAAAEKAKAAATNNQGSAAGGTAQAVAASGGAAGAGEKK